MSKPAAALPADLLLLLNDLEHVLSFNGLKGNQHTRYIADEIQAKADSRDAHDQGKLDQHTRSRKRANELLLKHEAYEMCFDAFFQSCTMHQPSYQATFQQKLWQHVMQLLEEWQDLHEQQQMQMKSLALDHLHLKHEHKALKANLKTLKLTVQTLLSDVSALLHHATSKDSSTAVLAAPQSTQGTSSSSSSNSSNTSSRSSGGWQLQPQQSSSLPHVPARRSSDIVNSLIRSIEKMTRQFAECQSGALAALAPADSTSRAAPADNRQHSEASEGEQAAAAGLRSSSSQSNSNTDAAVVAAAVRTVSSQLQQPSTASSNSSSSCSSAQSSGLAAGQLARQEARSAAHLGSKSKAGMPPLAPTNLLGKHGSWDQPGADSPIRQTGRNMITAKSVSGCVAKHHKEHVLAGASPHRSHPPSAFDSSLAWIMQHAESSSSSNSNPGAITAGQKLAGTDQAAAAAVATQLAGTTPGKSMSECQPADSTSSPQISASDVKSASTATPQSAAMPAFPQSTLPVVKDAAAQAALVQKQEAVVPSPSPASAASPAEPAATPVAEAATTLTLTTSDGAQRKQQQPEWMATLMQQPDALQKVRAAVRFALSPGELEPEPSVAEWASEAGTAATAASAAAVAEIKSAGSCPADGENAAVHAAQAKCGVSESIVAMAAPITSSISTNSSGSSSNDGSSGSQRRRSMQSAAHAGELSLMDAAAAEQHGRSLSTAPRAGKPGYALASAAEQQLQQMPNASRFIHLQQQQQQRAMVQVRSGSADAASKPGLQLQGAASSICTKRPASSHETRSGVTNTYNYGSSSNATATAATMGRSRSVGAGFSPLVPAGGAVGPSWAPAGLAAGPLTAALQRQTSLQKQLPAPPRPAGPFRQKAGSAGPAGTSPPGVFTAAQCHAAASAVEQSRLGGAAGAAPKHRPLSAAHGLWGGALTGESAAVVADAAPAVSAEDDDATAVPWNRDRNVHASLEQQQGSCQRLMRKQDLQQQQQQYMAAVPEGQIADAPERLPSDAMGIAANKAFSMASSSIGSDMVRLGSCNAGFWAQGSAVNNGSSSPPEQSTASQSNSPLVAASAAAADACGVAALLSSRPAVTAAGAEQTLLQSKGETSQARVAAATGNNAAHAVLQVAPQLGKPGPQQPAIAAVSADEINASAASVSAGHNLTAAGGNFHMGSAMKLAGTGQQQQQQHSQSADGGNSHSIAGAELKAEGSIARAEAYSGLIAAAAAIEGKSEPVIVATAAAAAPAVGAGEHICEDLQELPDVVKSAQRCDSPRKQPRSRTAAEAPLSGGETSTAEQRTPTAAKEAPSATAAADVAQAGRQDSVASVAADARVPSCMRASGDKRTLQRSRSSLSSSVQAQLTDDWAVRAMLSRPTASASPDDNSPLSPLCKRLRSSLVLLDTALSVLTPQEGTTSERCSQSRNAAAASASAEVHSSGAGRKILQPLAAAAGKPQSPCTATSEGSNARELQQQQYEADRMAQQQQQQQLLQQQYHSASAGGPRLSEDGGRDVGPVRDRDTSVGKKQRDISTAAGNTARSSTSRTSSGAADSNHRGLKSSSGLDTSSIAIEEPGVAAGSVASSADSVIASSADSSDMVSTATGQLAELAITAAAASAPRAAAAASPDAPLSFATGDNDTLEAPASPADDVAVPPAAAAAAQVACEVASCTAPCQLPNTEASSTSSLELGGPVVLCQSPDIGGALDGISQQAVSNEDVAADGVGGEHLSFSLDELVAILIDVMNSKQEQDDRLSAAGLLCQTPTAFLQRYLAAKVHGDRQAYGNALNALLSGLDAHKQDQPEVAVFCRILAGDVEEQYFDRHLNFRSQLQYLITQACEQHGQQPQQHSSDMQVQAIASWAAWSSMQLHQQQLLWLLNAWSKQRADALVPAGDVAVQQLQQTQREWWAFTQQHCCPSGLSADNVVSALLFWELQQHVMCLQSTVEAFRAADQQHSGLLDLEQFRVFCSELNDTMSNEEVLTLWAELDKLGHGAVTFSTICSCLLPAMNEA